MVDFCTPTSDAGSNFRLAVLLFSFTCKLPLRKRLEWRFLLLLNGYLFGHRMWVRTNGSWGPVFDVVSGVPRGSVLGPCLLESFMGTLSRAVDANSVIHADDVTLIEVFKAHTRKSRKLPASESSSWTANFCISYLFITLQISPSINRYIHLRFYCVGIIVYCAFCKFTSFRRLDKFKDYIHVDTVMEFLACTI